MSRRYAVLRFFCLPLIWLVGTLFNHRHANRDRGPAIPPGPKPLKARKRALTLPLPATASKKQKMFLQEQSALFRRLPEEVRLLIWEATIGGRRISLTMLDRRLRQGTDMVKQGVNIGLVGDSISLPLLLTCRRCYSEAISILYSTNVFHTYSRWCMTHLPQLLLPQRINAIRSLEFDWYLENKVPIYTDIKDKKRFRNYEREWYMIWQTLASMSGLRTLRVKLDIAKVSQRRWKVRESTVLQSATAVTTPRDFELALPWASRFQDPAINTLPCRVTKFEFPV